MSIWLSCGRDLAGAELVLLRAIEGRGLQGRPVAQALADLRQEIFRNGEHHRHGLHLGDDADAGGVAQGHVVALVDQAQADAARDRRDDAGIDEVELGVVDQRLVGDDRRLVLAHQSGLRVVLLAGDRILGDQGLVALQVDLGVLEQRLVLVERALRLLQRHDVGARIDHRQEIALLDRLAFGELDLGELAGDLRLHRHRRERRHGAQRLDDDRDVALGGRGQPDRNGGIGAEPAGLGGKLELEPLWVVMYQPAPATTARPNPIPSRVLSRFIY